MTQTSRDSHRLSSSTSEREVTLSVTDKKEANIKLTMKLGIKTLLVICCSIGIVVSFSGVPFILASHRLVENLKDEIRVDKAIPRPVNSVSNLLKKFVTACRSDAYLLIDQPGLSPEDLSERNIGSWSTLRKYMSLASTLIGIPWVEEPVDYEFLAKYIVVNCEAETIYLGEEDNDFEKYLDTRPRVFKVSLNPLPPYIEKVAREEAMRNNDNLIRDIINKLPSPHYTIILSSSEVVEADDPEPPILEEHPEEYQIFNDIVNHPSRDHEVERNARYLPKMPEPVPYRHTNDRYLSNRRKDEIHFFDTEHLQKEARLLFAVFLILISIILYSLFTRVKGAFALQEKRGLSLHPKND